MKELTINKNTNINKIQNKEEYDKLIINTKVYPFMLKGFTNIKELTIKRNKKGFNVYNEVHINELPFKEKIEKLIFIDVENYGIFENINKKSYGLMFPNLKSIEIIGKLISCNSYYFCQCNNLEEIIFNTENSFYKNYYIGNTQLKRVTLKKNEKEYNIDLAYIPSRFNLETFNSLNNLDLNYELDGIYSHVKDNLKTTHTLNYYNENMKSDNSITIPDFITYINNYSALDYNANEIKSISFNLKLLKTQKEKVNILESNNLKYLDEIIIRRNNNMTLFPNIVINVKKYGDIEDLYIENNKLYVIYNNLVIILDETGKQSIKKIEFEEPKELIEMEDYFKTYNIDELEEYFYYKKLVSSLKDNTDIELNNAMNIVGDRIIKKLTRK